MPEIFPTERSAQMSILDDLEIEIEQYKNGKREWDEIHWPEDEYMIASISIDTDGWLSVWNEGESKLIRHSIIETTLDEWRKSL